jgi:hypothetical protein
MSVPLFSARQQSAGIIYGNRPDRLPSRRGCTQNYARDAAARIFDAIELMHAKCDDKRSQKSLCLIRSLCKLAFYVFFQERCCFRQMPPLEFMRNLDCPLVPG